MARRRLWTKAQTSLGEFRVYVVPEELDDNGFAKHLGEVDIDKREISIAWSENVDKMKSTLWHEIKHVSCATASGELRKKALGGATPEARFAREELIISLTEIGEYDILTRNGWLKFPKPPRLAPPASKKATKRR